ncbi:hypothetical protein ACF0H5_000117 [Mactra antiquata]
MASILWNMLSLLAALFCMLVSKCNGDGVIESLDFCSFFNNRSPSPQTNLRNCTWFMQNSCCKQEEIDATFGTVKPLPGSSPQCQRYTNYLMCYVCAPYQNMFYRHEKLTVCEEFCDAWYSACSSAILKGSVIGDLYTNGREFCEKRNYKCEPMQNQRCFFFDQSLDRLSASVTHKLGLTMLLTFVVIAMEFCCYPK